MRAILRNLVFSYISLFVIDYVIGSFRYGRNAAWSIFLLIFALATLNFFMTPIFKLLSLPSGGVGYLFLSFILTLIIFYVLTLFIPGFRVVPSTMRELVIFGFVLPAKNLTLLWSYVFSALLFSLTTGFFNWLCVKK